VHAQWWKTSKALVGVAVLAVVSLLAVVAPVAVGVSSAAASAPPWEPDANAAPPYGYVLFFDSNGNQVTSGTNLADPFAYAVATTAPDSGANKANMDWYDPQHGVVPGSWGGSSESGTTTFTSLPSGTPAAVAAYAPGHPVVASTGNITTWLAANTPDTTAGYANTIQVRVQDSGPGGVGNAGSSTYWESDIGYNTTSSAITVDGTTVPADGWAQLFPLVTATTTTMTSPASGGSAASGSSVTLTASVSPAETGTVQFYDGTTAVGSPVTVTAGTATTSTTPAVGAHSYTATFNPTLGDLSGGNTATAAMVGGSTSTAISYTITGGQATTTTLTASPTGFDYVGDAVGVTATVSPAAAGAAGGTVQFEDGGTDLGSPVAVDTTTDQATMSTSTLALGGHSLTAVFTPTNTATFSASTSPAVAYQITPPAGGLTSLTPDRLMDTRSNLGATGPVGAGATVKLKVAGVGPVPASGVGAVVLNVTVTAPTASSYVTVYPDGVTRPTASNLNFVAGQTVPNLVVATVGADGYVDFYNAVGNVQLIADVAGWLSTP
jgi:Bacterial Ig-like domain (group 3)